MGALFVNLRLRPDVMKSVPVQLEKPGVHEHETADAFRVTGSVEPRSPFPGRHPRKYGNPPLIEGRNTQPGADRKGFAGALLGRGRHKARTGASDLSPGDNTERTPSLAHSSYQTETASLTRPCTSNYTIKQTGVSFEFLPLETP